MVKFLPGGQIDKALEALARFREANEERFRQVFTDYNPEVNDNLERSGIELPQSMVEKFERKDYKGKMRQRPSMRTYLECSGPAPMI